MPLLRLNSCSTAAVLSHHHTHLHTTTQMSETPATKNQLISNRTPQQLLPGRASSV
jgi:hypothetical protein